MRIPALPVFTESGAFGCQTDFPWLAVSEVGRSAGAQPAEGLQFARLATFIGKRLAARWGERRVTIGAVGWKDGERWVMGTFSDGTIVLGQPNDFSVPGEG